MKNLDFLNEILFNEEMRFSKEAILLAYLCKFDNGQLICPCKEGYCPFAGNCDDVTLEEWENIINEHNFS